MHISLVRMGSRSSKHFRVHTDLLANTMVTAYGPSFQLHLVLQVVIVLVTPEHRLGFRAGCGLGLLEAHGGVREVDVTVGISGPRCRLCVSFVELFGHAKKLTAIFEAPTLDLLMKLIMS